MVRSCIRFEAEFYIGKFELKFGLFVRRLLALEDVIAYPIMELMKLDAGSVVQVGILDPSVHFQRALVLQLLHHLGLLIENRSDCTYQKEVTFRLHGVKSEVKLYIFSRVVLHLHAIVIIIVVELHSGFTLDHFVDGDLVFFPRIFLILFEELDQVLLIPIFLFG